MTRLSEQRRATGQRAETAATGELQTEGFAVTNLNDLVGNCPFATSSRGGMRPGSSSRSRAPKPSRANSELRPRGVRALEAISAELGCAAIYAFVPLIEDNPVIRFAAASNVAELADEAEADYPGTNRYHVDITQFDAAVDRTELLC
jgi:hypothetical protein